MITLNKYFREEHDQLSLTRTTWFFSFIEENIDLKSIDKSIKILDVGCGNCSLLYLFKKKGFKNIHGCDIGDEPKKFAKNLMGFKSVNLNNESLIKLYSKKFDLVTCTEVLEHLFDPEKTLNEIINISNKYILLTLPLDLNILARIRILLGQNVNMGPWAIGGHIKFFKPKDLLDKLNTNDIKSIQVKYLGLGYGILDTKMPFLSRLLARTMPTLFSSDMLIFIRKK